MTGPTLSERSQIFRLGLDQARRAAVGRVLGSTLLRWRYGAPIADEILIVPQELRAADPSFASELEFGQFGIAGAVAAIGKDSPFALEPPSADWSRELHGFGWLRHLKAAGNVRARDFALGYVDDWIKLGRGRSGVAAEPAVAARRLISWTSNAGLLLEGVDRRRYERTTNSLGDQLIDLAARWRVAPEGYPRLITLLALVLGELCIAGHEKHLAVAEQRFAAEFDAQILPDGGHVSRNPAMLVELLLDVLPLRQCYAARKRPMPAAIDAAIMRIMPMLRFMRLGDGGLARFNGVGAQVVDALVSVLAYDPASDRTINAAPQSRYARLECGNSIVLADIGSPPRLVLAGQANAGALAFEFSSGPVPMIVNGGAPGPADQSWRPASRATASHNTIAVAGRSSSRLVRDGKLETLLLSAPICQPDRVEATVVETADGMTLQASHDGYVERYRLIHRRQLQLANDGRSLAGLDQLVPPQGNLGVKPDLPYAAHFHLHPAVAPNVAETRDSVELTLRNGERWRFTAAGATISLEESVHFADISGPSDSLQLVLRGTVRGDKDIAWRFERVDGQLPAAPDTSKAD